MQILTPSLDAILNMLRFSTATTVLLLLLLLSLLVFYYSAVVSTLEWKFWLQISTWGASPFAWKKKRKRLSCIEFIHSLPLSPPFFQSSPSSFLPPSSTTGWCRLIGDDTETCHVLLCSLLCIIKTRATLHFHCSGRQMRARARDTGGEIRERKNERERERGERVFCYFSS